MGSGLMDSFLIHTGEKIVILGGAVAMIWAGIWRIYKTARNVDKILDNHAEEKDARDAISHPAIPHPTLDEKRARA